VLIVKLGSSEFIARHSDGTNGVAYTSYSQLIEADGVCCEASVECPLGAFPELVFVEGTFKLGFVRELESVGVVFGDDDVPVLADNLGKSAMSGRATNLEDAGFVDLNTAASAFCVWGPIFWLDAGLELVLGVVALLGPATCAQDAIGSTNRRMARLYTSISAPYKSMNIFYNNCCTKNLCHQWSWQRPREAVETI
jgi:hypothetical protein